jgi:amino acid adenylation domain-containing protein
MSIVAPFSLVGAFRARATAHPAAVAVEEGETRLSYAALDAWSDRIAAALIAIGIVPGAALGLCLPRSAALVAAMLGGLKAGATLVPLDAASPPDRQAFILRDAGCTALLAQDDTTARAALVPGFCGTLEALLAHDTPLPAVWPTRPPQAPAFLFYTSGTTGTPKGVEVGEAGIDRLHRAAAYGPLTPQDRVALVSNPAFDALSFDVWGPLLAGACCVTIPDAEILNPARFAARLESARISVMFLTVALFNMIAEQHPPCFRRMRRLLIGGEALNAAAVRAWYQANPASPCQIVNVYGPTETTTFALGFPIPRDWAEDQVPIGTALPDTRLRLLTETMDAATAGDTAELYIGGTGVAYGYRNRPEETASRFVTLPEPDGSKGRYYRTGDLVRLRADGGLDYRGRADRQIKIRGFRVEPGEIEACLCAHPAVRQAYVCAHRPPDAPDQHRLLAFLVTDATATPALLRAHLSGHLPAYMHPHRLYRWDALPLTPNGKIDQARLLQTLAAPWEDATALAPPESDDTALARLLALAGAILGQAGLTGSSCFTECGGDSLLALRFRFAVQREFGADLPIAAILSAPFAHLAEGLTTASTPLYPPLPARQEDARRGPATAEQTRLWLLNQRDPDSTAYNTPFIFRVFGEIDTDALAEAVTGVLARHPGLRARFALGPEGLEQVIEAEAHGFYAYPPGQVRADTWEALAALLFATPFDLSRPGLFQTHWMPFDRESGVLLLHAHHSVLDGWSLSVIFRDLAQLYAEACDGVREPISSALSPLDVAAWQRGWHGSPAYAHLQSAARCRFAQPREPLPARTPAPGREARILSTHLPNELWHAVDAYGRAHGVTPFETLAPAFAWAIAAVTGLCRPRLATPVANRPLDGFAEIVGMLANTVPLTLDSRPAEPLGAQAQRFAATLRADLAFQDVAYGDAIDSAAEAGFDFLFVLENTDFAALRLGAAALDMALPATVEGKCPLTLTLIPTAEGLTCVWEYQPDYISPAQTQALADQFETGLRQLFNAPEQPLAALITPYRLGLLPPETRPPVLPFERMCDWVELQADRTPDAPALVTPDETFSYARLLALADYLAAHLLVTYGAGLARVALYTDGGAEHIVALLALAKLNATIVPLDTSYPAAILGQIVTQAQPDLLLCQPETEASLAALGPVMVPVDCLRLPAAAVALPRQRVRRAGDRPLYLLFTSGSTGTPKGVTVPDATLSGLLLWHRQAGGLGQPARTLQFSKLAFDVSFQEIFGTLSTGGCFYTLPAGLRQDAAGLLRLLAQHRIERIHMPYVAVQLLAEAAALDPIALPDLRAVISAGEQVLCTETLRGWFERLPNAALMNHYGPTETHVVSAYTATGPAANWPLRLPIGTPITGARLLVVDDSDLPLPPGVVGHLLIGGPMVNPCYLDAPQLNTERFGAFPALGGLFYRTGDLARLDADGLLHYHGRTDEQVKLSGHRLELGQVEAALMAHPAVETAIVEKSASDRLTAYIACRAAVTGSALAAHLAPLVPAFVRIDQFWQVETWPMAPSGKIDRKGLGGCAKTLLPQIGAQEADATGLEAALCSLFEATLGLPIRPDQTYFEAGASSLSLMRFHLACRKQFGWSLGIADLFSATTPRRLAARCGGEESKATLPTPVIPQATAAPIAIIGLAVKVPGADTLANFWDMIREGGSGIQLFTPDDPARVGARAQMAGMMEFDPGYFGLSPQEARLMDPQQRQLLMGSVEALAHAGLAGAVGSARIGVIASGGESTYFQSLLSGPDAAALPDGFQMALHHEKDFLATKIAYHLNLTGPALTVQTACSSSLAGLHLAAGLLRQGDADAMLVGGVLIDPTLSGGYTYRPNHIFSQDGQCRAFGANASGTIGGSGYGVLVLKPLAAAERDGNRIYAVLEASALNNDGREKMGYAAPSIEGQAAVIDACLHRAGLTGSEIGYVEAHGTGTALGDPIEIAALSKAFSGATPGGCALGSLKSQIGHLGAAAGVLSVIRAALALYFQTLPPTLGANPATPAIDWTTTPFRLLDQAHPWPATAPRRAAVSSFGIGGTNAHVILREAAMAGATAQAPITPVLLISAHSAPALAARAAAIAAYLRDHPARLPEVLAHLQGGDPGQRWRIAAVGETLPALLAALARATPTETNPADRLTDPAPLTADDMAAAWIKGARFSAPLAAAPWDFPPPVFDRATYSLLPPLAGPPARRAPSRWLHRPLWVPTDRTETHLEGTLLILSPRTPTDAEKAAFAGRAQRVIWGSPDTLAAALAQAPEDAPLFVLLDCAPGTEFLETVASVAAPLAARRTARLGLVSCGAAPGLRPVTHPAALALGPACRVIEQEYGLPCRWVDCAEADLAAVAALLTPLFEASQPNHWAVYAHRLWRRELAPQALPILPAVFAPGTYLILGGTGGIGAALAAEILSEPSTSVVLVSRSGRVPDCFRDAAARVTAFALDVTLPLTVDAAVERLLLALPSLRGIVHAVGIGAGALLETRPRGGVQAAYAAKLRAAEIAEALAARLKPAFLVYCSSMATEFGGVGQFDYAAANALLDGYAFRAGPPDCQRLSLGWDIWRDEGMAANDNLTDARHQAHRAVGLTATEGRWLFRQALALPGPHLLISTVAPEEAAYFYAPRRANVTAANSAAAPATTDASPAACLRESFERLLGLKPLPVDTPLTDLGADSLTLLDALADLESCCGIHLALSKIGPDASLTDVIALALPPPPEPALWNAAVRADPWRSGRGDRHYVLIHPVGGDVQAYRALAQALPRAAALSVIADPRLTDATLPPLTVTDRAAQYRAAISAPANRVYLIGWSFGAWVAGAMAAQAEAEGSPFAGVTLIDPPAPDAGAAWQSYSGAQIDTLFRQEVLSHRGSGSAEDLGEYLDRLTDCCRANMESMIAHRPGPLLATPAHLVLAGKAHAHLPFTPPEAQRRSWAALLRRLETVTLLPIDHYGLMGGEAVQRIAEGIGACAQPV